MCWSQEGCWRCDCAQALTHDSAAAVAQAGTKGGSGTTKAIGVMNSVGAVEGHLCCVGAMEGLMLQPCQEHRESPAMGDAHVPGLLVPRLAH